MSLRNLTCVYVSLPKLKFILSIICVNLRNFNEEFFVVPEASEFYKKLPVFRSQDHSCDSQDLRN